LAEAKVFQCYASIPELLVFDPPSPAVGQSLDEVSWLASEEGTLNFTALAQINAAKILPFSALSRSKVNLIDAADKLSQGDQARAGERLAMFFRALENLLQLNNKDFC
jgi:hypothetical protein